MNLHPDIPDPARLSMPALLVIGGSSRNVGKTSLAEHLIHRYAASGVTGLKVTSIRPGDEQFHGTHAHSPSSEFTIFREVNTSGPKDTTRMLNAGAEAVFYIQVPDTQLERAFRTFITEYYTGGPIICESRSLRKVVKPGLFVLLKNAADTRIKPDFSKYEALADWLILLNSPEAFLMQQPNRIHWDGVKWQLSDAF